ncbi:MAG: hypothetical protein EOO20_19480, partial [Chryseobacterium sp.]
LFTKQYNKPDPFYGGFPYVDLLVKGVTDKFFDVTTKGYEKTIGKEFGKSVKGIFSDEMTLRAMEKKTIRWTPDLFSEFKLMWGYELQSNLPSLFENVGEWRKVRHNYFQTLLHLFIERWAKPYTKNARDKKLLSVSNYFEHTWPNPYNVPDNMAMYSYHDIPGVDMLFNEYNEAGVGTGRETQFGNLRAIRELASVANQFGKKRSLSESYGGAGWDLTFKDMKRLTDWEYALGVNMLTQHLSFMSIYGSRKYDYPQSFSYQNPWYNYYGPLNKYNTRLSLVLSQGQQINQILVLQPTTSAWMYAVPPPTAFSAPNKEMTKIGEKYVSFIKQLEKSQAEYDIGSENILRNHASVNGKQLVVGKRTYKTIIIPPGMESVDRHTFELLNKFLANGGKIVQFEDLQFIDGSVDPAIADFNNQSKIFHHEMLDQNLISTYFANTYPSISLSPEKNNGNIYHHRRILNGGQIVFLANADMDYPGKGRIDLENQDVLLMDPYTGKIWDFKEKSLKNRKYIDFEIPPAGSLMFYISDKRRSGYPISSDIKLGKKLVSDGPIAIKREQLNVLTIDFCDILIGNKTLKDQFIFDAADTVYKHHGFENGNPWDHTVQFKQEIMKLDTFRNGSGFTASYHFTIQPGTTFKNMKIVVEQADLYAQVLLNGKLGYSSCQ